MARIELPCRFWRLCRGEAQTFQIRLGYIWRPIFHLQFWSHSRQPFLAAGPLTYIPEREQDAWIPISVTIAIVFGTVVTQPVQIETAWFFSWRSFIRLADLIVFSVLGVFWNESSFYHPRRLLIGCYASQSERTYCSKSRQFPQCISYADFHISCQNCTRKFQHLVVLSLAPCKVLKFKPIPTLFSQESVGPLTYQSVSTVRSRWCTIWLDLIPQKGISSNRSISAMPQRWNLKFWGTRHS